MSKKIDALKLKENAQKKNKKKVDKLFKTGEFDFNVESEILLQWIEKVKEKSFKKAA